MERYNDRQFLAPYGSCSPFYHFPRGLPLSPILQLLVTLRFYDATAFKVVTGDLVNVSQPTVCRTVGLVRCLIARHLFKKL
ncbi:hypothetical protein HPB47_006656, partial [Ixodes persulcatus]